MSIFKERDLTKSRKALRELARVKRSIIGMFAWVGFLKAQRKYDANWDANLRVTDGQMAVSSKIALVVLYQPNGLRGSFFETLSHLKANGYSVLAVSNTALSSDDLAALKPHVWKICERPNYGYDLGAYRDGIWLLRGLGVQPDHVILMNDSIWFPLCPSNTTISQLEQSGCGLNGMVRKTKARRDNHSSKDPKGFIEAYFYLANLNDATFAAWWETFWTTVKLTAGREYLREGKVSDSVTKAGFKFHTIASRQAFLDAMSNLPDDALRRVLLYAAYPNTTLRDEGAQLQNTPPHAAWRQEVLSHIRRAVQLDPFYGVFVYGSERAFGLGFIKRTPKPLFQAMHRAFLQAVTAGDLPKPMPHMLDELTAQVAGYANVDA